MLDVARDLVGRLGRLDEGRPGPAERQERLLTLESRADPVLRELARIYGDAPQPMDDLAREALAVARALALALARAYKSAAVESRGKVASPLLKAMTYAA